MSMDCTVNVQEKTCQWTVRSMSRRRHVNGLYGQCPGEDMSMDCTVNVQEKTKSYLSLFQD